MFSLQVPKPQQGRRFVIADVHGCMLTLVALIKKIGLTTQDQLFFSWRLYIEGMIVLV